MNKIILTIVLTAFLCGCKRTNFVDGCLFGERLGDELDWTRCALFVSGIGETGVGVDDSMVIVKSPLRPFAVSAPIEQYVACTNSSGKVNVLLYTSKCPDWSKSPDFVKGVDAVIDEFKASCNNQYIDFVRKDKGSDTIEFLSMRKTVAVSICIFKYKDGGEMTFMALTSDIESLADR